MKRFLLLTILTAVFSVFTAQGKLGISAGVTVSNLSFKEKLRDNFTKSNCTGFTGGLTLDAGIPIPDLSISTGILYTELRAKINDRNINNNHLDVPLYLKWNIKLPLSPLSIFAQAGPYFSLAADKENLRKWSRDLGNFNNYDVGLGVGAGISLLSKFEIGVNYGLGLTDTHKKLDSSKDKGWSILATYYF